MRNKLFIVFLTVLVTQTSHAQWSINYPDIYYTPGNVIIGTNASNYRLHVQTDYNTIAGYFYNNFNSPSATYGLYSNVNNPGAGNATGGYFVAGGAGGTLNRGLFASASGNQSNYGTFSQAISSTGQTAIGLYGTASGSGTNYAGRFDGRVLANGNVGIFHSNPAYPLQFASSEGDKICLYQSGSNQYGLGIASNRMQLYVPHSSDAFVFGTGSSTSFTERVRINGNGRVGIGITNPQSSLHVDGRITADELRLLGGSDVAENFDIVATQSEDEILPGMLVSINPDAPGQLQITNNAYDKKVAGIISGANGVKTGLSMGQEDSEANGKYPIALAGRVYVLADASHGEIVPGNFLTSSPIRGYAMKAEDPGKAQGAIVGKAMTQLKKGKGYVLVLVNLQ